LYFGLKQGLQVLSFAKMQRNLLVDSIRLRADWSLAAIVLSRPAIIRSGKRPSDKIAPLAAAKNYF